MKRELVFFLLVCWVLARQSQASNITRIKISSYLLPNKTLSMELDVIMPTIKGTYPVILFLTGLEGLAPEFMQSDFTEQVATEGIVFMSVRIR